jgi:hypothetical protein
MMEWYYAKNGQQLGPVSQESLLAMYQSGEIKASDLVWNEAMTEWLPLSAAPGLGLSVPPPIMPDAPAGSPPPYTAPASAIPATTVLSSPMSSGQPMPPNYLWQSIVSVIFCCWPFSIPAIIFATKVKPAFDAGDYAGAVEASNKAKMWFLVSLIVGLIVNGIFIVLTIVAGMAEAAGTIPQ